MGLRTAPAVLLGLLAIGASSAPAGAQTPVKWTIGELPKSLQAGRPASVTINAVIDEGWKVYSLTQAPGGPIALAITVKPGQKFSEAGVPSGPLPHVSFDPNFNFDTEYYEEHASFRVPFRLAGGADPTGLPLRIVVLYQTCNQR